MAARGATGVAAVAWYREPDERANDHVEHGGAARPAQGVLGFLERRLSNRAAAEEVLQAAYVKAIEHEGALEDTDRVVAWFYRILRNALADEIRRRSAATKAVERLSAEPAELDDAELHGAVCTCVTALLPTLKAEYAEVLRRTEIEGASLATVAADLGTSTNNVTVRAHRARAALRKRLGEVCGACSTHGCLDCTCGGPSASRTLSRSR